MMLPKLPIIKTVSDLRYKTPDVLALLNKNEPVLITRDAHPTAVMLSPALYTKWRETFADLLDTVELEKAIEESNGTFYEFDELIAYNKDNSNQPQPIKLGKPKKKDV